MFDSVLIANRGEIACRIIRTARRLGLRTIAVHSEADAGALFVAMADEAVPIGPAPARDSYLSVERILAAARRSRAACLHPGYGFLSERPELAEACAREGIAFIGPSPEAIRAMGLKDSAKALVAAAGVPVVPGYHGPDQDTATLRARADEIGYPVLVKAVAGGGGRGLRRVERGADFAAALEAARREAEAAFGDPRVLLERFLQRPRHIEVQVFGDRHGRVVHLFERDCSLQRRHQKVMEEAPAPGLGALRRAAMGEAAVAAARAVGYVGAGTVEFVVEAADGPEPERFYFLEMNTRLQVEHAVTEAITGLDLVELQFRVAAGEPLLFGPDEIAIRGHAVEARLYAEDPERGFLPSSGRIWALRLPQGEGLRVETGVREGDEVTPFYDPMIAKLVAHGPTREAALDRLSEALGRTLVAGPKTNTAFLKTLCDAPAVRLGAVSTTFIDEHLDELGAAPWGPDPAAVAAGALALVAGERERARRVGPPGGWRDPWDADDGFQLSGPRRSRLDLVCEDTHMAAVLHWTPDGPEVEIAGFGGRHRGHGDGLWAVSAEGGVLVVHHGRQLRVARHDPFAADLDRLDAGGLVTAPMHGRLAAVFVRAGERVQKGQPLAVVEAMKMEHPLLAPASGTVTEAAEAGGQVAEGMPLIRIAIEEDS